MFDAVEFSTTRMSWPPTCKSSGYSQAYGQLERDNLMATTLVKTTITTPALDLYRQISEFFIYSHIFLTTFTL
jgi:hypothetical protein